LQKFWDRYGSPSAFQPMYSEVVTKLLEAEDLVVAQDYKGAKLITDALIAKYPLSSDVWWTMLNAKGPNKAQPHLGEPGAYAHLRMLDDITKIGVTKPLLGTTPMQMTVVLPACSDIVPLSGPAQLNHRLSPEVEVNNYEAIYQSLRLFQSYILAITGGELRLEVKIYKVDACVPFDAANNFIHGYNKIMHLLPEGVIGKTDMFWVLYPFDYSGGPDSGGGGGLTGYEHAPLLISEDDWVIKKRTDQGGGIRTEVERRMYLPEWLQHEVMHLLFQRYPHLGLENTSHQWFDRNTWPAGFVGSTEEDYYSEALNKMILKDPRKLSTALKITP
jgi:hypothetical protein